MTDEWKIGWCMHGWINEWIEIHGYIHKKKNTEVYFIVYIFNKWWLFHGNEDRMLFSQNKQTSQQNLTTLRKK